MTYRTIPQTVQAVQWWKHGDDPRVEDIWKVTGMVVGSLWDKAQQDWIPVHSGEWIVTHPNGTVEHVTQQNFNSRFEPLP